MTADRSQVLLRCASPEGGAAAQLQSLGQQHVIAASRVSSVYLDDPQNFATYRDRLRREHDASVRPCHNSAFSTKVKALTPLNPH